MLYKRSEKYYVRCESCEEKLYDGEDAYEVEVGVYVCPEDGCVAHYFDISKGILTLQADEEDAQVDEHIAQIEEERLWR